MLVRGDAGTAPTVPENIASTPGKTAAAQRERLRRACVDFEGIVLGLMVREMQATVKQKGALPLGTAGQIFTSLWGQALAREGAKRGPLGIADALMAALSTREHGGNSTAASSSTSVRPTVEIEAGRETDAAHARPAGAVEAASPLAEERERQ